MSDYPAAAQEGATSLSGLYPINQEHTVSGYLENWIAEMEAAAAKFAKDCIKDADGRVKYQQNIKRLADQVRLEAKTGKITPMQGAEFCQTIRNRIMEELRVASTAQGRAYAEKLKPKGRSLEFLMDKYAGELFKKPYSKLTAAEQSKVYYAIIEASGRSSAKVNAQTRQLRVMGKVALLVTAGLAIYSISTAENKEKEIITQGAVVGAGLAGGWAAGLAVSAICGPGAPICALAVVLAGTVAAGAAADAAISAYDDELEEFTKWGIR